MNGEDEKFEPLANAKDKLRQETSSAQAADQLRDEELATLLRHWSAPDASPALDNRTLASYRRMMDPALQKPWRRTLRTLFARPAALVAAAGMSLLMAGIFVRQFHQQRNQLQPAARQQFAVVQQMAVDNPAEGTRYSTYINLSGFKPVQPVRIHIIRKER